MIRPADDPFRRRHDAVILARVPFPTLATTLEDYVPAPSLRPQGAVAGLNPTLATMYPCVLPGGSLARRRILEGGPDHAGWLRLIAFAPIAFLALMPFRTLPLPLHPSDTPYRPPVTPPSDPAPRIGKAGRQWRRARCVGLH